MRNSAARMVTWLAALVTTAMLCGRALAQDYTITSTDQRPSAVPVDATDLDLDTSTKLAAVIDLPFPFTYYGRAYRTASVLPSGFILLGGEGSIMNQNSNAFTFPLSNAFDGVIAPLWDSFNIPDGEPPRGTVHAWTTGSAPDRVWTVAWDEVRFSSSIGSYVTVHLQLHESTGVIEFIYEPGAWTSASYSSGLDSLGDTRYTVPLSAGTTNSTNPSRTFVFTPREVAFTGSLAFDRLVSDDSGIGGSVESGVPLAGLDIELSRDGGIVVTWSPTDSDGAYDVPSQGVSASSAASLRLFTSSPACTVLDRFDGAPYTWRFDSDLDHSEDVDLGAQTLDDTDDTDASIRAAFNVAMAVTAAHDWVAARAATTVPQLEVVLDTLALRSGYQEASQVATARMRVAGIYSSNPDAWDDAVIQRIYARHVLAQIAALPTAEPAYEFDAVTDDENAFAEGFGCYLAAVVSGTGELTDGTGTSTGTSIDLEDPRPTSRAGADVAARVAAALYDLVDPANEDHDTVDGTGNEGRVLAVVESIDGPVTAERFRQAWIDAGYDAAGITRNFIGNGVLPDDDGEPNVDATEAAELGAPGAHRSDAVLNRYDEDWWRVDVPAGVATLVVEVAWNRIAVASSIAVEALDGAGQMLAVGAPQGGLGPYRVTLTPPPTGALDVRIRHDSGALIPAYTVQVFEPLSMPETNVTEWTVGRPFAFDLGTHGGVLPLRAAASQLPPGMFIDQDRLQLRGTPTSVGAYDVLVTVTDAGDPVHDVSRSRRAVVNPPLTFPWTGVLGFAQDRPAERLPSSGGTPPLMFSLESGAFPGGIGLAADGSLSGTPDAPGSSLVSVSGVDVAGSLADGSDSIAVVCALGAKKGFAAPLAAGTAGAGWYVDAVAGSTLKVSVKTAKKRAKRALATTVQSPDSSPLAGGKIRLKAGRVKITKLRVQASGRHFVLVTSEDGDETELLGSVTVALPRSGKDSQPGLDIGSTVDVPVGALAGARLTFTASTDKKSGAEVVIQALIRPDGSPLGVASSVKTKGRKRTLSYDLDRSGTWHVRLIGAANDGGTVSWKYKIRQPKGGSYSIDD